MCAVFKRTHNGTKLQTELHLLAHRINHLYFLLEQCTGGNQSCLSRWGWIVIIHCLVMTVLHYHRKDSSQPCFLCLADIPALKVAHSDMEGAKKWKGEKKWRRRKREKKEIKRERLCIFLYIKSIILVIATKGQGLEFHSLSCTTGAVTVLTLSPCCDDACRSALWEQRESRVHPVMYSVCVWVCACVRCGCIGDTFWML